MALSAGLIKGLGGPALSSFSKDKEASVSSQISTARGKIEALGQPAQPLGPLASILQNLSRTGYAGTNMLREFTSPDKGQTPDVFDPFKAFGRGFSLDEQTVGKDIMTDFGLEGEKGMFGGEKKFYNPSAAGITGLALDILNPLDALNWLSFGTGKAVTTAGKLGSPQLAKVFGSKVDDILLKAKITNASALKSNSVGKLVSEIANNSKLEGDALSDLLRDLSTGLKETGSKATDKLKNATSSQRLAVSLQNPLTLGRGSEFLKTEIPGTGRIGGAIADGAEKFSKTRVGNALGKMFSTKHIPSETPDYIIKKNLTTKQLDDIISNPEIQGVLPVGIDELNRIKATVGQMVFPKGVFNIDGTGDTLTLSAISQLTKIDGQVLHQLFDYDVPYTFDIMELYDVLKSVDNTIDEKEVFRQSVALRKLMDHVYDQIPEELKGSFKGTTRMATAVPEHEMLPGYKGLDQTSDDSPLLSYVFDRKGVEVVVSVNNGTGFNDQMWQAVKATLNKIDEMPEETLSSLNDALHIAPINPAENAQGFYDPRTMTIHLREPGDLDAIPHEFGHSSMDKFKVSWGEYQKIIDADDSGFVSSYVEQAKTDLGPDASAKVVKVTEIREDFAEAFNLYVQDPAGMKANFPERYNFIDELVKKNQIDPEELAGMAQEQTERGSKMAGMPKASKQIDTIMGNIDRYVVEHALNTSLKLVSGSETYTKFKGSLQELYETTLGDVDNFYKQVDEIFKDIPVAERKQIMTMASEGYLGPAFLKKGTKENPNPAFYSKAIMAVEEKMPPTMNVESLRNLLLKEGVNKDEMKWMFIDDFFANTKPGQKVSKEEFQRYLTAQNLEITEIIGEGTKGTNYSAYTSIPGGKTSDYRELILTLPRSYDVPKLAPGLPSKPLTRSANKNSHWGGQEDVAAHVRFSEVEEGDKTILYIQEIQSDWHQTGRKKGYRAPGDDGPKITKEQARQVMTLWDERDSIWEEVDYTGEFNVARPNPDQQTRLDNAWQEMEDILQLDEDDLLTFNNLEDADDLERFLSGQYKETKVPEGPFMTTWPKLVMRRMFKYASDRGYDTIRIASGQANSDLYKGMEGVEGMHKFYNELIPDMFKSHLKNRKGSVEKVTKAGLTPIERVRGKNVVVWTLPDNLKDDAAKELVNVANNSDRIGESIADLFDKTPEQLNYEYATQSIAKSAAYELRALYGDGFVLDEESREYLVNNIMEKMLIQVDYMSEGVSKDMVTKLTRIGRSGVIRKDISESIDELLRAEPSSFMRANEVGADMSLDWLKGPGTGEYTEVTLSPEFIDSIKYDGQPLFRKKPKEVSKKVSELSPKATQAMEAFLKWKDSVVKEYHKREIPLEEMEKYVPFVPERRLNPDESALLKTLYGTGTKSNGLEDVIDPRITDLDPNLKPRTTKAKNPAEVNQFLEKEWVTEDSAVAMAIRGSRAIKAQNMHDFLEGFIKDYGIDPGTFTSQFAGQVPHGYKLFTKGTDNFGRKILKEVTDPATMAEKGTKAFMLPEVMATEFNTYVELISGTKEKNKVLELFDQATGFYKKVAYLWNPGHIVRDLQGNIFNGYLMGVVNPVEYARAAKLLATGRDTVIKVGNDSMTIQQILDKGNKIGLFDIGAAQAESPIDILDRFRTREKNVVTKAGHAYSRAMRDGTKAADLFTRFTGLLHNIEKKGMSFEEAAGQVKKYMFDYFELTPFERKVMKRVMPFYTWMRKNIPLQVSEVMTNPRNYSRLESLMTAAEEEPIDWEGRPDYINDTGAFKMGDNYVAPNLPSGDLSRLPTNLDSMLQILSGVNPLIKGPVELATNQQWFNQRPVENYAGEQQNIPLGGLLKMLGVPDDKIPQISKRGLGYLANNIPVLRNIDIMTDPDNPRQAARASSFVGGPSWYSKDSVDQSTLFQLKTELSDLLRKLKDEGVDTSVPKSDISKIQKIRDMLK